ncbi:class I SAM-dependent methyltransferase [Geobacter benzoatilyticus]|uniref:Methyltransferase domain-containing protein n=1 Tax=Geobacter benzoatilyticus TaxID=2815309 RepID=A0ABX7Q0K7_9BACT|nr:methyltransferase domain-containing protein [Geobacter benzoatilyticus]QSV44937.1 methyltransferase domain-containing protein [Geobacter benzoatilyticus]
MISTLKHLYGVLKWKIAKNTTRWQLNCICCPVCKSKMQHVDSNTRFNIVCCTCCGHATTSIQLNESELDILYDGLSYWQKDKGHQGIINFWEGNWDDFLRPRLESIYDHAKFSDISSKNVLEIGCSEGKLLHELNNRGHKVLGFECNKTLAEMGSRAFSLPIKGERFTAEKLEGEKFDLVLAYHTIEHVANVGKIVSDLSTATARNGKLVAELPIETIYNNPDHIHYFTEKSIQILFCVYYSKVEIVRNGFIDGKGDYTKSVYVIASNPTGMKYN